MTSGMNIKKILSMTDHTLLRVGCTQDEIDRLCDEAVEYHCAAVCVPPCYVSFAKDRIFGRNKVKVGVTVGFPNGYNTPEAHSESHHRDLPADGRREDSRQLSHIADSRIVERKCHRNSRFAETVLMIEHTSRTLRKEALQNP